MPTVLNGTLRVEKQQGHTFIGHVVDAFPDMIDSVSLSRPTLEDVFIARTGHRFWEDQRAMTARTEMKSSFLLSASALCRREIVRFLRQRSRIIGALGSPLIFWLLLGSGVGTSFAAGPGGSNYLEYYFPGTVVLILLFTSIFATISIIEDRKEGFLQAVLVAPIPRSSFVFGKMLGATSLALIQGVLFMLLAPLVGFSVEYRSAHARDAGSGGIQPDRPRLHHRLEAWIRRRASTPS